MIWAWFSRLSRRERMLALLVGGTIFLLINYFLWEALLGASAGTRKALAESKSERKLQKVFLSEREMWRKREEWLKKSQPAVRNAGESSAVLDEVKEVASKSNIALEHPQLTNGDRTPSYQALGASFETKTAWEPLVRFLYNLQQPEKFLVCESINLTVDGADKTQMRGKFKVTRWYTPGPPGTGNAR